MVELNIGGHLSLDRNPAATVEWAAEHGFTSMQIFASSPGAWKPPIRDEERASRFRAAREQHGVQPLVIHSIYLINLASQDDTLVRRSISSLTATMHAG